MLLFVVQLDSGVAQVKVWELCKMGEMWKGGLGCVGLCSPCPRAVGAALPGRWHPLGTGAGGPAEMWEVQGASGELGSCLPAQTHQIPLAVESLTVSFLSQVSDELVMGLSKRGLQR